MLQQYHSYVRHRFSTTKNVKTRFSHAELYKIIDKNECAFPNVDIAFHIFLTLMVTNCSSDRSFSQLKYIKNPIRTSMQEAGREIRKTNSLDIMSDRNRFLSDIHSLKTWLSMVLGLGSVCGIESVKLGVCRINRLED